MKKKLFTAFIFIIGAAFGLQNASAQITINLPKFPKLKKEKPKTEKTTETTTPSRDDQPQTVKRNEDAETEPVKRDDCSTDAGVRAFSEDAEKQLADIESFTPGRGWFVRSMNYSPLIYAVSLKARAERYGDERGQELLKCQKLISAYETLAAAAAKKLPQFVPNKNEYLATTPANVNLMKGKIDDLANHKIFHTGIKEANWLIEKDDYNFPTARFKHGLIWARYTPDDHQYCWIYYVNLVQDYAGGGTYGATYAKFAGATLAGCPATAK